MMIPKPKHLTCSHLRRALNRVETSILVAQIVNEISATKLTFDAIAFCGNSGALVAPLLAQRVECELIMVRKAGVQCNSPHRVEGYAASKRYVILDDLIASGRTACHIAECINDFAPEAQLQALILYTSLQMIHLPGSDTPYPDIFRAAKIDCPDIPYINPAIRTVLTMDQVALFMNQST